MKTDKNEFGTILNEEGYLNFSGKLFLTALGSWLVGKAVNTKLRGSRDEISAVTNALLASRKFQDELRKPGATIQSVIDKLHVKQMSAAEFERVMGVQWPL